MSLASSHSRKELLASPSRRLSRYLAAWSLPLVLGNTSRCPMLLAHRSPAWFLFLSTFLGGFLRRVQL